MQYLFVVQNFKPQDFWLQTLKLDTQQSFATFFSSYLLFFFSVRRQQMWETCLSPAVLQRESSSSHSSFFTNPSSRWSTRVRRSTELVARAPEIPEFNFNISHYSNCELVCKHNNYRTVTPMGLFPSQMKCHWVSDWSVQCWLTGVVFIFRSFLFHMVLKVWSGDVSPRVWNPFTWSSKDFCLHIPTNLINK